MCRSPRVGGRSPNDRGIQEPTQIPRPLAGRTTSSRSDPQGVEYVGVVRQPPVVRGVPAPPTGGYNKSDLLTEVHPPNPTSHNQTSSREFLNQHPKGATQLAPGRRPAGKRNGKIFDPCGRTPIYWCDHKGREGRGTSCPRRSSTGG